MTGTQKAQKKEMQMTLDIGKDTQLPLRYFLSHRQNSMFDNSIGEAVRKQALSHTAGKNAN